jgi:hypothetical protein
MVDIIAHRGWWRSPSEKNSKGAFERALIAGYGIETDLRDQDGRVVISHDVPTDARMSLEAFLKLYSDTKATTALALNIKSDGLAGYVEPLLRVFGVTNYFVFDMSVPDTLEFADRGMRFYVRHSEYEPTLTFEGRRQGVWFDAFAQNDLDIELVAKRLAADEPACLVSPELHDREHLASWHTWRRVLTDHCDFSNLEKLTICTDFPEEASAYFSLGVKT